MSDLSVADGTMYTMDHPVRLPADALAHMLGSRAIRDLLDASVKVEGAGDWPTRHAEAMEALAIVSCAAEHVFASRDEAGEKLFLSANGGGFGIRESLRGEILSLLQPVVPRAFNSRYERTTREQDLESAVAACVFAVSHPHLIDRQRVGIINGSLWLVTERTPSLKYTTRYRSQGAKDVRDGKLLAHEHVHQRREMVRRILANPSPVAIRKLLEEAVGCTVLRTKHKLLGAVKNLDGWARYKTAKIQVYDCGMQGDQEPRIVDWAELGL